MSDAGGAAIYVVCGKYAELDLGNGMWRCRCGVDGNARVVFLLCCLSVTGIDAMYIG